MTDFTWSGAAPSGQPNWSSAANWSGGAAPSGSAGTLNFPALTSGNCTGAPPSDTCYHSNDDISGLSVNKLAIDEAHGYNITGDPITLGAGGITATSSVPFPGCGGAMCLFGAIDTPITLGVAQTWSFDGDGQQQAGIGINGDVTGGGGVVGGENDLAIDVSNEGTLGFNASVEVGAVNITGANPTDTGNPGAFSNGLVGTAAGGDLNGSDGNPINVTDAGLFLAGFGSTTIGPLTSTGGAIPIGNASGPAGIVSIHGGVTLDAASELGLLINQSGTTAGTDYWQLNAKGDVTLGNASLILGAGGSATDACPTLTEGDVDTMITTTGAVIGTFAGVPDGTIVQLDCVGTAPTLMINYTGQTVTATVITGGSGGTTLDPTGIALSCSPTTIANGQPSTCTATVTDEAATGATAPTGTVSFTSTSSGGRFSPGTSCSLQPTLGPAGGTSSVCQVTYSSSATSPSQDTITASYRGDSSHSPSSVNTPIAVGCSSAQLADDVKNDQGRIPADVGSLAASGCFSDQAFDVQMFNTLTAPGVERPGAPAQIAGLLQQNADLLKAFDEALDLATKSSAWSNSLNNQIVDGNDSVNVNEFEGFGVVDLVKYGQPADGFLLALTNAIATPQRLTPLHEDDGNVATVLNALSRSTSASQQFAEESYPAIPEGLVGYSSWGSNGAKAFAHVIHVAADGDNPGQPQAADALYVDTAAAFDADRTSAMAQNGIAQAITDVLTFFDPSRTDAGIGLLANTGFDTCSGLPKGVTDAVLAKTIAVAQNTNLAQLDFAIGGSNLASKSLLAHLEDPSNGGPGIPVLAGPPAPPIPITQSNLQEFGDQVGTFRGLNIAAGIFEFQHAITAKQDQINTALLLYGAANTPLGLAGGVVSTIVSGAIEKVVGFDPNKLVSDFQATFTNKTVDVMKKALVVYLAAEQPEMFNLPLTKNAVDAIATNKSAATKYVQSGYASEVRAGLDALEASTRATVSRAQDPNCTA